MIKYVTADMLDFSVDMPDMIIHQTNCEGRMGGGVAKTIKEKFPQVYVAYLEFLAQRRFNGENNLLGQVLETNVRIGDNILKFVDVFAQNSCSENASLYPDGRFTSYDALHDGLLYVRDHIVERLLEKRGRSINIWMPAKIGCVKGGESLISSQRLSRACSMMTSTRSTMLSSSFLKNLRLNSRRLNFSILNSQKGLSIWMQITHHFSKPKMNATS